jgi:hypothetical protein
LSGGAGERAGLHNWICLQIAVPLLIPAMSPYALVWSSTWRTACGQSTTTVLQLRDADAGAIFVLLAVPPLTPQAPSTTPLRMIGTAPWAMIMWPPSAAASPRSADDKPAAERHWERLIALYRRGLA